MDSVAGLVMFDVWLSNATEAPPNATLTSFFHVLRIPRLHTVAAISSVNFRDRS